MKKTIHAVIRAGLTAGLLYAGATLASEARHLSVHECSIAGQVGYAAALVRDHGGEELQEHAKIDHFAADHPRRELWLVTHDITAFAYQHPEMDPISLGSIIVHQCESLNGDLRFPVLEQS